MNPTFNNRWLLPDGIEELLPPDAQVGLLGALADRGDTAAHPAVLKLLAASRDESVRVAAIGALGSLGEPSDWRQLVQLSSQQQVYFLGYLLPDRWILSKRPVAINAHDVSALHQVFEQMGKK